MYFLSLVIFTQNAGIIEEQVVICREKKLAFLEFLIARNRVHEMLGHPWYAAPETEQDHATISTITFEKFEPLKGAITSAC